ncbi:MAG: aspartyl protease family protein [Verrucomicrobiota bacterium]|nr:aspartyl protease family protein [Verrucomicrobiota bacterium]
MRKSSVVPICLLVLVLTATRLLRGGVALSQMDAYVVSHGYAGAQFIAHQNTYRLPVNANGKAGDLTIDTGAPTTVMFRATVKKFGLQIKDTEHQVHGAFGKGKEKVAVTSIAKLAMGNCTLMNVKAAVLSDAESGLYRTYGSSDGLFGLREMVKYGAVLDLANHLLLVHPGGGQKGVSAGINSILTKQGYTAVDLDFIESHLRVKAVVNGTACQLIVDTGAFLTTLDGAFARKARLGGYNTGAYARGLGTKARPIRVTQFPEFKVGDFLIKNASVTVTELDPELLGGGGKPSAVGLLGAEYLGRHGAIFDFNNGTLYLRPKSRNPR